MKTISEIFREHRDVINTLDAFIPPLELCVKTIMTKLQNGGTIFWMGNGGSAADAQHMAAELIGRFQKERHAIASIALTTDTSILTSIANDYSFDAIFARQLEGLCKANDVVIGISTSGNSENVLRGIDVAKERGAFTIGMTGHSGGKLKDMVDVAFVIPSQTTARIQEAHALLCHTLCECIEDAMVSGALN